MNDIVFCIFFVIIIVLLSWILLTFILVSAKDSLFNEDGTVSWLTTLWISILMVIFVTIIFYILIDVCMLILECYI